MTTPWFDPMCQGAFLYISSYCQYCGKRLA